MGDEGVREILDVRSLGEFHNMCAVAFRKNKEKDAEEGWKKERQ